MRKVPFVENEYYHIFNRGVDKRAIFLDENDLGRFLESMQEFNTADPIGSIYQNSFAKRKNPKSQLRSRTPKLVGFVCYCLNPNHFHFLLSQISDDGIVKFMQRLGTGYTNYFNSRYKRSGSLFQGKFKSVHVSSDEQLLHLSAYVNLNDRKHQLRSSTPKLVATSWGEYVGDVTTPVCKKNIVLGQFKNKVEYKQFALSLLDGMLEKEQLEGLILE